MKELIKTHIDICSIEKTVLDNFAKEVNEAFAEAQIIRSMQMYLISKDFNIPLEEVYQVRKTLVSKQLLVETKKGLYLTKRGQARLWLLRNLPRLILTQNIMHDFRGIQFIIKFLLRIVFFIINDELFDLFMIKFL